mmetsp:Transcript_30290/g.84664  ORF Transcript_30290/g.84664 Transcript_30290/m.84664 type:complete len:120 (+) Transcript_30290:315-674(+)
MIGKRASGELMTTASWIREFVTSHPEYKKDSVVSQPIAHDLVSFCNEISHGNVCVPKLLGTAYPTVDDEDVKGKASKRQVGFAEMPERLSSSDNKSSYVCLMCGKRHSKLTKQEEKTDR